MTYLRFLLGTTLLVLAAAAGINFTVDPSGVYGGGKSSPDAYADTLIKSTHGLWWPEDSLDERLIKKALAKYSGRVECLVIGSSHVMQVGSHRGIKSLQGECETILNLGVSGAGIEDHITLAFLALKNGRPKKIVFGVDPWTLAFGKDQRWSQYATDYGNAYGVIVGKAGHAKAEHSNLFISRAKNLFSLEYTVRSIGKAVREYRSDLSNMPPAPQVDEAKGGDNPVLLPDGSLIYSAQYIADHRARKIPLGGGAYKTDGELNQNDAVEAYRSLIRWVKSRGVEPVLLLTPYHENVWKSPESPNAVALRSTESAVSNLSSELKLRLIGSYDPHAFGCLDNEFYDFMHPTADCLRRLQAR